MTNIVQNTQQYFETLDERFVSEAARGVSATVQFELSGDEGGEWFVRVEGGQLAEVASGRIRKPTLTLGMDAESFIQMTNGALDGVHAYMVRKLRVAGNLAVAQRMHRFLPPHGSRAVGAA